MLIVSIFEKGMLVATQVVESKQFQHLLKECREAGQQVSYAKL